MKYDILIAGSIRESHGHFWNLVAERFEAEGAKVAFMPAMQEAALPLAHRGEHVCNVAEEMRRFSDQPPTPEEIADLEKTYDLVSLRSLIMHEMYSTERYDEERLLRKTVNYFRVVREFFERHEVGLVIEETGGWIECQTVFRVARSKGIPHFFIEPGPMKNTVVFAFNAMNVDFGDLSAPENLSDEENAAVDAFIAEKTRSAEILVPHKDRVYYKDATFFNVVNPNTFAKVLRILHRKVFVNRFEETFSTRKLAVRYLKSVVRRKLLAPYYRRLPEDPGDFIYFPLHMPFDMQILVRAPQCFRQEFMVEMISRALPQGVRLFLKEHPVSIGWHPFPTLRSLAKLPNVILLHPGESSQDIIRKARAVITINSKVGFEALAYGRPVITLGASFYRGRGATFDVFDLADLAPVIKKALSSEVDEGRIRSLLAAVLRKSHPGELYDLDPANTDLFFKAMKKEMGRLEEPKQD